MVKIVLILLLLVIPSSLSSVLLVRLQNVPTFANFTILCEDVVAIYGDEEEVTARDYCSANQLSKVEKHFETSKVKFTNFTTTNTSAATNTYPTELNDLLSSHGFFSLDNTGNVTLVSNVHDYLLAANATLGTILGVMTLGLLGLIAWTSC
jgi:hypothetical protein